MFNNQIIAGAAGQGGGSFYSYSIDQSLRFNNDDSAFLKRDITTTSNAKTWTWSAWVKRSSISTRVWLFGDGKSSSLSELEFQANDTLYAQIFDGSAGRYKVSTQLFRDVGAWYHIVWRVDTTQATAADRNRVYINGEQITDWSSEVHPNLNSDSTINVSGNDHVIGAYSTGSNTFDGYMAEVNFIDGTALDATSFGEFNNGVWVPKAYNTADGAYGTNGFYLSFADSAAIGDDLSGNTNDFTATNLAASDVVSDSPTNSFCTLNPLTHGTYPTLSEGNLKIASVYGADLSGVASTWFPTTGKWYWEVHNEGAATTYPYLGITDQRQVLTNTTKGSFYSVAWLRTGGSAAQTGTNTFMGTITKNNVTSWTNDDIIMFALDVDARKLWIGKNGTWDGSGDPAAGTGQDASWTEDTGVSPSFMGYAGQGLNSVFNFGQDGTFAGNQTAQGNADENGVGDFYYSPPSGFLAMATSNIEDGAISPNAEEQADDYFNTVVYTGNGTAIASGGISVTGVNFQPDFVWIKSRTNAYDNMLFDSVRGPLKILKSNSSAAEITSNTENLDSFDADGFTYGSELSGNASGASHVSWNWKAGGTAVSNTDGSITSSVSAAPDAGVSIMSWTGTGANATVGHGLSSAPEFTIVKGRDAGRTWATQHKDLSGGTYYIGLETTNSELVDGTQYTGFPTNSVINVGTYNSASGEDFIAYCFHSVEGYLKCGKYRGNGNANGMFVYTGFRPAFLLLKKSSGAGDNWSMYDNKRDVDNVVREYLIPNTTAAAASTDTVDFLSNGFKVRNSGAYINTSGATYIYLAFAEQPLKFANAR